jgi:hypothetical protein
MALVDTTPRYKSTYLRLSDHAVNIIHISMGIDDTGAVQGLRLVYSTRHTLKKRWDVVASS